MDNQLAIATLLKEIRGEQTQSHLSEELGFSYNQYFKWENGQTAITLQNFIDLCRLKGINIDEIFLEVLHCWLDDYEQETFLERIYTHWWHNRSEQAFLVETGFSKSKWYRLKSNQTKLNFDDFLIIVNVAARKRDLFLKTLSKNFRIKKHLQHSSTDETLLNAFTIYPEFISIYSCFFLPNFLNEKNSEKRKQILVNVTGYNLQKINEVLDHLKKHQILDIDKNEIEAPFQISLSRINIEINNIFKFYCLKKNENFCREERESVHRNATTAICGAVSSDTLNKIVISEDNCWAEIAKFIAEDDPAKKKYLAYFYGGVVAPNANTENLEKLCH